MLRDFLDAKMSHIAAHKSMTHIVELVARSICTAKTVQLYVGNLRSPNWPFKAVTGTLVRRQGEAGAHSLLTRSNCSRGSDTRAQW